MSQVRYSSSQRWHGSLDQALVSLTSVLLCWLSTVLAYLGSPLVNPLFWNSKCSHWILCGRSYFTVLLAKPVQSQNLPHILRWVICIKQYEIPYDDYNRFKLPFKLSCLRAKKTSILQPFFCQTLMVLASVALVERCTCMCHCLRLHSLCRNRWLQGRKLKRCKYW